MNKLSLKDLDVKNKHVLIRVDFNVPLDSDGNITDATRILESLPTINYVLDNGGSAVLMSHLGRPDGKVNPKYSLAPCAKFLSKILEKNVNLAPDCTDETTLSLAKQLKPQEILLLENLRFHEAEEQPEKDPSFAKKLSLLGDIYINDAFGTAHRKHSSTATIAQYFPGKAAAGFLMQKEIDALADLIRSPKTPFYAIIGGSKISTKLKVLQSLSNKVSAFFIGGGMSYTFLKSLGIDIGESIVEEDLIAEAKIFLKQCEELSIPVFLPQDIVIANSFSEGALSKTVLTSDGISKGWQGMDTGMGTCKRWAQELSFAKTIFWNGPIGVYEMEKFSQGTNFIASSLASLKGVKTIVGGGDSVAAINHLNISDKFTHISTGGGASMEFIENGTLPGIEALSNKKD